MQRMEFKENISWMAINNIVANVLVLTSDKIETGLASQPNS